MAEGQAILRQGYLNVEDLTKPSTRCRRWVVLNVVPTSVDVGLEHFDNESKVGRRVIPLSNCKRIESSKTGPYMFELWCDNGHVRFGCSTRKESNEWVDDIKRASANHKERFKSRGKESAANSSRVAETGQEVDSEDPPSSGTFGVTLKNNIYAQRMNLTSTYKLRVTLQDITLLSEDLKERIAMWMYSQLRNFRTNDECVEIEAGRAAETGPGTIIFLSPYAKEIYSLIKNNVRALAKQARTSQTASFSQIDASPYEIPARSIATLQGKGLRLHHDARSHDALNQHVHVLPQSQRIPDESGSYEEMNYKEHPSKDSIPATLSGDGTERLENSYTELWNTKEGGQDAKCPVATSKGLVETKGSNSCVSHSASPSMEDEYVVMQAEHDDTDACPDQPTTTEGTKVLRGPDDYAIVIKSKHKGTPQKTISCRPTGQCSFSDGDNEGGH